MATLGRHLLWRFLPSPASSTVPRKLMTMRFLWELGVGLGADFELEIGISESIQIYIIYLFI